MHAFFHFFGLTIPAYGFLIAFGVVIANVVAFFVLKYTKKDFNDFIILEAYCFLGAFIGAKLLYFIVSYDTIDWSRITEIDYFNQLMLSGFVFYGGLVLGLISVYVAGKIYKINAQDYVRTFIFLIPFIHCFGRLGCFMAGCCYGIPYEGVGAVVFPEDTYGVSGISLFPVQLVEAGCLMVIAIVILLLYVIKNWYYTIETYLISYAILRFVLEYLRYDEARGHYLGLSTSQWISITLLVITLFSIIVSKRRQKRNLVRGKRT